jgi:hypothetical protein
MAAAVFMPMHSHGGCDGTDTDTQAVAQVTASVSTRKGWYETWLPMLTSKSCEPWLPMLNSGKPWLPILTSKTCEPWLV